MFFVFTNRRGVARNCCTYRRSWEPLNPASQRSRVFNTRLRNAPLAFRHAMGAFSFSSESATRPQGHTCTWGIAHARRGGLRRAQKKHVEPLGMASNHGLLPITRLIGNQIRTRYFTGQNDVPENPECQAELWHPLCSLSHQQQRQ